MRRWSSPDTFGAIWQSISGAYVALFQGAIYDARRDDLLLAIRPITQTLVFATPLIAAGLGVAIAFRVGLFNIGGRGQIIIGAAFAGYASFAFDLPVGVHLVVADADAVLVVEVHAAVAQQHFEHVVALVLRAGDGAEHADALNLVAERVDEAEGDGRLARVALGGGDVDAARHCPQPRRARVTTPGPFGPLPAP